MKRRILCLGLVLVFTLLLSCAVFAAKNDQDDQAAVIVAAAGSGDEASTADNQSSGSDSGNAQRNYLITGGCVVGVCILLYIFVLICNKRGIFFSGGHINRRGKKSRKIRQ